MRTTIYFLSFLLLLSFSSCSQGTVNTCTPQCDGKQCGDDGCGGTCQPGCGNNETCDAAGQCIPSCTPDCDGKECGPDGCIGVCPPGCSDNETCNAAGQCVSSCIPDCNGKECGPDGCDGTCPPGCDDDELCTGAGQCVSICSDPCVLCLDQFGIKADGSDETAELQSAFDYAGANSICAIVFPANKVIGLDNYVETPENVELVGNGCTIKLLDGASIDHENSFFYIHAGDYAYDLIFDGNMDNQGGSATNGVGLYSNVRFVNNEVKNIGAYSLSTYRGDNILIHHNRVHDTWQYGIATSGEGFPTVTDYSDNNTITNNTIYNCGQVGIKIRQTSNTLVKGNIITVPTSSYDDSPAGIRLYTLDGANHHITITENEISGPGDGSIAISSDDSENSDISITNNQITNANTGIVIRFNDGIITGNSITYRSVCIEDEGTTGNTVTGNSCDPL
jgi:parallel beta-helix repeat protein